MFLVDEEPIVTVHDRMIASDAHLARHLALVNSALEYLSRLPEVYAPTNDEELALLRLAIRCFNSGSAALRLLRCGYFQPAMTMVRDLIEVSFLMDLFDKKPGSLSDWLSMSEKDRKKHFKPVRVRETLDELDGFRGAQRQEKYEILSKHAAHVNPDGFQIISPGNMTRIGPFFDYGLLKAGMEEIAPHLGYAAVIVCTSIETEQHEALEAKGSFLSALEEWRDRYLPSKKG